MKNNVGGNGKSCPANTAAPEKKSGGIRYVGFN
jgi:hypothetical protein